jgi:nitrous oxidase accessory protein
VIRLGGAERRARRLAAGAGFAVLAVAVPPRADALMVMLSEGQDVQAAVDRAAAGDIIRLAPGRYDGPVRLDKPLVLEGDAGAMLVGPGCGSVVTVAAPGAVVRGLEISGSGVDLEAMDAGVFVEQTAAGALVEGNRIDGNLYGIYLHGAADSVARGNHIIGLQQRRINEAGNGVSIWNAPGARVEDNDIRFGRDGIFVITSRNNVFRNNRFSDVRFAVHYMYTNDSEVSGNVSTVNAAGFTIMYSHRLLVRENISVGDRDRAFLFNYANGSEIVGNVAIGRLQSSDRWAMAGQRAPTAGEHGLAAEDKEIDAPTAVQRIAPEKCVFIYNANNNRFHRNRFEGCEIGIHFTAGSERNEIFDNAFINNRRQVKYVGTRFLDWSKNGRGNYWSDNPAFDLNADGIADTAYRPNDLVDTVLWTAPQAKVLLNSPAVQVLRWAQSHFPAILPGGVTDSHPLMSPPAAPVLSGATAGPS